MRKEQKTALCHYKTVPKVVVKIYLSESAASQVDLASSPG